MSDIVATAPLPEEVRKDLSLISACVGGAEGVEKILNKDDRAHEFRITGSGLAGLVVDYAGPTVWVGPGEVQAVPVRIRIPDDALEGGADIQLAIEATDQPDVKASGKARFIAPTD